MKLSCEMKDCDTFDIEKDICSSSGSWNGCRDWMGFDGWNYTKKGEFVDKYG